MFKRIAVSVGVVGAGIGRAIPAIARDFAGLAGIASISYGAWLISPPAGYMVGGALLVIGAVLLGFKK